MPLSLDQEPKKAAPMVPVVFSEIKKMTDKYRRENPGDTRSAWVSVAEVSALIADNNANGIRIYFGRHADDAPESPGKLNVTLVATRDVKNPTSPGPATSKSLLDETAKPPAKASSVITLVQYMYPNGDFENMGDDAIPLCPDHCPDSGLRTGLD
jgi:hypothetical protein